MSSLAFSVRTMRESGLEARWTRRSNGAPVMVVRDPKANLKHQRETWWKVGRAMWDDMQKEGIRAAFSRHTMLGDVFSL